MKSTKTIIIKRISRSKTHYFTTYCFKFILGFNVKSLFDETALYLNNQYTYNNKFKNKVWRYILKGVLVSNSVQIQWLLTIKTKGFVLKRGV